MPRVSVKISNTIPNFENVKVLKNFHVLYNFLFFSNKKKKYSVCVINVLKTIKDFCEKNQLKITHDESIKRKINNLFTEYKKNLKNDKKDSNTAKTQKKLFRKQLEEKFAEMYFTKKSSEFEISSESRSDDDPPAAETVSNGDCSDCETVTETESELEDGEQATTAKIKKNLNAMVRYQISLTGGCALLDVPRSNLFRNINNNLNQLVVEAKSSIDKNSRYLLHFDGKSFFDRNTRKYRERNCYVLTKTNEKYELVLGVPFLQNKTALSIVKEGVRICTEWDVIAFIKGLGMDTTSTNTGRYNGACVKFEQYFNKKLIWFACRHHIAELVLGSILTLWEGNSKSPEIQVLQRL